MKSIKSILGGLAILGGFIGTLNLVVHAQTTAGTIQSVAAVNLDAQAVLAQARALAAAEPVLEQSVPVTANGISEGLPSGTYWGLQNAGPPLPFDPFPDLPVYVIDPAKFIFIIDDRSVDYAALQAQQAEPAQAEAMGRSMMSMNVPFPGDGGGEEGSNYYSGLIGVSMFDTNALWLEITNVDNGLSYLNLHNGTNQVYAIWSTTDLVANWQVETEVWPTNGTVTPFTVWNLNRQNLFLRAEDWTGVTENGNTTPDWWFWLYFGTTALSDTNLDSGGVNTLLHDYTNGLDPNVISFSIAVTNNYVNSMSAPAQLNITAGTPGYYAVAVDDTNYAADAGWQAYPGPNITVNLGAAEGWHGVWIGLRGLPANATQTWHYKRLKLDLTPPRLAVTSPTNNTVMQPVIQLTGFSPEALFNISYDITNAVGLATNQQVLVLDQYYDTNVWVFTTNRFQAFDVPLTNGVNLITLRATDLAGNVTTTNFSFTLDYSSKTNPPVVQVNWPRDGMKVCGNAFTCDGWVSDPTATVTVQVVATNGNTSVQNATVGRDGHFWAERLSLSGGTNYLTLTATDAAGNMATTNFSVAQGDIGLAIDSVSAGQTTVTGEISSSDYTVWVNGSQATNNGNGTWTAQIAPIGVGG
ncbi:MAG: hypothetical protein ABSA45_02740, partial [Verrucomicrobiota bacterium]